MQQVATREPPAGLTAKTVRTYEEECESAVEHYDVRVSFMMRGSEFEQLEAAAAHRRQMTGARVFLSDVIRHAINEYVNHYIEPPWVCRRHFGLSYAAIAVSSSMAW